jgi:cytochrome P450
LAPRVVAARARPPAGLLGQLAHHRDADGAPLAVSDVIGHLLLLFWAGYDTTASSGAWVLHELARRADWQERLRAGDEHEIGWFLLEIERLYPSALFFPRVALEDFRLGEHTIPRGTPVFYSPYMSHRDPAAFDAPSEFDPERFAPARGARRASAAKLVGFGGGPRVCLGKTFAKLQLKIMIETLLQRFSISPGSGQPGVQCLPVHHPTRSHVRVRALH